MIMAKAPVLPWVWDYETNVASDNVLPVINQISGLDGQLVHIAQVR